MDWSGFHRRSRVERLAMVAEHAGLDFHEVDALSHASALPEDAVEAFIENTAGVMPVPLGFGVNFVIDGAAVVVPMAVEESSVVAAASHGAKLAAAGGGFTTFATRPVTIGQVEVRDVKEPGRAPAVVEQNKADWMAQLNDRMASMVDRGGGMADIVCRVLEDRVVVHLHVDTQDAMGANLVNSLCESISAKVAQAVGGREGLRILSNLADERLAEATCRIPVSALGGAEVAEAMVEAEAFAHVDPYRAATHNKGIMNGIDPVVLATGNDWRAVEAGAHAYAAREGRYEALTDYIIDHDALVARLRLPLSVGTVGGVTRKHPVAAACLKVLGSPDAMGLARIMAAVGLAQNVAALRALASEGIQEGHMRLHASTSAYEGDQGEPKK